MSEPKKPTVPELKNIIAHLKALREGIFKVKNGNDGLEYYTSASNFIKHHGAYITALIEKEIPHDQRGEEKPEPRKSGLIVTG